MAVEAGRTVHGDTVPWYARISREFLDACDTPCYIYSPDVVVERWRVLRALLGTPLVVSLKANADRRLFQACAPCFLDGIEVSSTGEVDVATSSSRLPGPVYLNNPSLSLDAMGLGCGLGCTLVVDSLAQARSLCGMANSRMPKGVMLRLNGAEMAAFGLPMKADHFGMTFEQLVQCGELLLQHGIAVEGIHTFRGSRSFVSTPWSVHEFAERLSRICDRLGNIRVVNLGGGFPPDIDGCVAALGDYARALAPLKDRWLILHEAGRAIFSKAGVFAVKVLSTKVLGDKCFVQCDGGMAQNFLLARTESMYKHFAAPVLQGRDGVEPNECDAVKDVYFVGTSCNSQDVIGHWHASKGVPAPGDYLLFPDCGAYNSSYTVSDFLLLGSAQSFLFHAPD